MHSENIQDHDEGMLLYQDEVDRAGPSSLFASSLAFSLAYMKSHRDIIAKFGRYPHRNAILGRQSSPEEIEYLVSGGETFDARKRQRKPSSEP